jgi:hypothetical protein
LFRLCCQILQLSFRTTHRFSLAIGFITIVVVVLAATAAAAAAGIVATFLIISFKVLSLQEATKTSRKTPTPVGMQGRNTTGIVSNGVFPHIFI